MRYNPFTHYDKHGVLKPPLVLYGCLIFLVRSYFIWIAALSFRQDTSRLLGLFYPDKQSFVTALLVGLPALVVAIIVSGRRNGMPAIFKILWGKINYLLAICAALQLASLLVDLPQFHHLTPTRIILLYVFEVLVLAGIAVFGVFNRRLRDACREFPQLPQQAQD